MVRVGIAGLGTVGAASVNLLQNMVNDPNLTLQCVTARDKDKDRGLTLSPDQWRDTPLDMVDSCDILVEVMGGTSEPIHLFVDAALNAGKKLVTANKALLAQRPDLLTHPNIYYEAAVGGGVPMIRTVRDYLHNNRITKIQGILNGTCNFILCDMVEQGCDFQTSLSKAQELGYAEADPSADIDGIDTAQKLMILARLAFGTSVSYDDVDVQGIRDIQDANQIRLVATADKHGLSVKPCSVEECVFSGVSGPDNILVLESEPLGKLILQGPGAGGGPTASAIVADIIDAAQATA